MLLLTQYCIAFQDLKYLQRSLCYVKSCTWRGNAKECCIVVLTTDSAESYLNQALASYESLYGCGHAKTLEVKDELARLMIRTDRIEVGMCECQLIHDSACWY